MADYRIFCFDGSGRITVGDLIVAATDDDAIGAARSLANAAKCELWLKQRLVATLQNGQAIYGEARPIM